jgi:hypothetical protein
MATLDELRLTQLLQPFEGPSGIATLNPLAFQYQNPQYPNSTQMFYQPRMDISPTQDFYQPRTDISPTQDFYQPRMDISPTQDFYQPRMDISPTQDFYQPREFVNAPQNYYQPDLTTLRGLDLNRFKGIGSYGVANEEDVEQVDSLTGQKKSGGILDLIMSIAVPGYGFLKNMGKGGLEGIRGLNQRLRNTDFGQSRTLQEYFQKRGARKEAERLAPIQKQLREASERGGGYQPTTQKQNVSRTASRVSGGKTRAYGL